MTSLIDMKHAAAGLAALSICESLLLALDELKILGAKDAAGVLDDAAAAHRGAGSTSQDAALHLEVAAIIESILASRASLPKP